MPSRFEYAQVDGLSPASGFIELDRKTPEEFATLILKRLAINEGKPEDYYTKPVNKNGNVPRTSIPHNLPALQPFFGREDELRKIADALDPESRTWGAVIDGPGGMGKTSLAVRAAYDAPPHAFDKIAFVTLKSRELDDDGVKDLSGFLISGINELFNELARELGKDEITKAVEGERPRLLLDVLRGTRTLLILDNLESLLKTERDTVFNFVKRLPPGCKAILTSRVRLGSGAEELILEKLDQDAALQTLAKLAESNPALARTSEAERIVLYKQTAGKPLLLRWTAGQIGRGSCVTFTDAITYLRSCPKDNDPLEFIFGDLVKDFSEAETRALCALTYFNLPAKMEHIADIAECKPDEVGHALKLLINRSLVVPSEEFETFTLVPLVADFLRVKKPEGVRETGDRLEKHAYALVVENGYQKYDRFPLIDAAWPTVAAALPRFLAGDNNRLQIVCQALWRFLEFTGRWDESIALSQDGENRAMTSGDHSSAGWRAYSAGWIHNLRGQPIEVLDCAERAEAHWHKAKSGARERAAAIRLGGTAHRLAKNYTAAIAAFREAVELLRSLGHETIDVAAALNDLAIVKRLSGDLEAAQLDLRECLRIAQTVKNDEGIASYTGNLALLALTRKDWPSAEALAGDALLLSEKIGRIELIANQAHFLAMALVGQGKKAEALPFARRAVEIFQKVGSPDLARAKKTLAKCES